LGNKEACHNKYRIIRKERAPLAGFVIRKFGDEPQGRNLGSMENVAHTDRETANAPDVGRTFFEADRPVKNPKRSHPHAGFAYTRDQMTEFGAACGWATRYIGDWNHPRQQKILQYSVKL
jgi:hypothetical protein